MNRIITLLICLGISSVAWSKNRVLVSGFDPFGGASDNNSWRIAEDLQKHLPEVEVVSCLLPTSYQRAIPTLTDCLNQMPEAPQLIISLGSGGCKVKWETRAHNRDHDMGPDNDGVSRRRRTIEPNGPNKLGLRLNYAHMWCSLNEEEKKLTQVSVDPDNFVCNNTAYRMSFAHPDKLYGFIHVPATSCERKNPGITAEATALIAKMIRWQLATLASSPTELAMPDFYNAIRLPGTLSEVRELQAETKCEQEFLKAWRKAF